jgi:hypothetical protein
MQGPGLRGVPFGPKVYSWSGAGTDRKCYRRAYSDLAEKFSSFSTTRACCSAVS